MTNHRVVLFQGMQMEVPDWVHFITQDRHGTIKVWELEPKLIGNAWMAPSSRYDIICNASAPALLVAV